MDSTRTALATIAATARDAYSPHDHMQVRSSGVVHAVALTRWLAGELLLGPACMVRVSGWDPYAAYLVQGAVTCLRCLRLEDSFAHERVRPVRRHGRFGSREGLSVCQFGVDA